MIICYFLLQKKYTQCSTKQLPVLRLIIDFMEHKYLFMERIKDPGGNNASIFLIFKAL